MQHLRRISTKFNDIPNFFTYYFYLPMRIVRAPPLGPLRRGVVPLTSYRACPMPFSFASVRARTQDQRDILKWGALSLPTGLVAQLVVRVLPISICPFGLAQLVVRVLPISICPFGLGFELSRRRKKRAWDMPL